MISAAAALVVLLVTLGVFAVVGVRAWRRGGVDEYVVARDSQGGRALGWSYLAAGIGAWVLFAPPEIGAVVGLVPVLGYAVGAAAPLLLFAVLGPVMRRAMPDGRTLTEFTRRRFGRVVHVYVAALSVLYMLTFVTAELTAVGGVTAILSGLDPRVVIVAVAVVAVGYTVYGGIRASISTDRWQAWMVLGLLGAAVVAAVLALPAGQAPASDGGAGGGLGAALSAAPLGADRVGFEAALTLVLAITAANMFHQGYWQRVWSARDTGALRRSTLWAAAGSVPIILVTGLLGMAAVGAGVALGDPPVPLFALLGGLPAWALAGVLVLALALVTSTVDTLVSGLSALVAVEQRPGGSVGAVRLVTALLMIPAVLIAFQGFSVLRLLLVADLLCATVVVPVLLGLWRRVTPAAVVAGAVAGLVGAVLPGVMSTGSVVQGAYLATFPGGIPGLGPFAGAVVLSTLVTVAVTLLGGRSGQRTQPAAPDSTKPADIT